MERDLANADAPGAPARHETRAAEREVLAGALVGYEIGEELGRGACGLVLGGYHRGLGREVAIKRLPRMFGADPELRARFLSEARLLASLDHPHIVRIYDFVEADGVCALVMQRLTGGTVWDRIDGGVTPQAACAVIVATCRALQYAHGKGVLHRDIKPQNLMFSDEGVLKVTDFGIAKVLGAGTVTATHTGEVLGTPAYIAPELIQGAALGPAIDVYATGVLFYLLLCGELPFPPAADAMIELYQHVHLEPVPLLERNPKAPAALGKVTACALARDPEARYASAQELAVAVSRAATQEWGSAWARDTGVPLLGAHPGIGDAGGSRRPIAGQASRPAELAPDPGATVTDSAPVGAADRADGEPEPLERDRELQALSDALQDACVGQGALVLISGPAGIGKTRLAREAAHQARAREMQTLSARADELEGEVPLRVVRQLFEPAVREVLGQQRAELLDGDAAPAADFLIGEEPPTAVEGTLDHTFFSLAANLADDGPLALVVDDADCADAPSLRVLLHLVARLDELPLALVLTARPPEPGAEDLLARFAGDRFAPHLRPAPLSAQAVAVLLRARWKDAADAFCMACRTASAGNPFLVLELASEIEAMGLEPTAINATAVPRIDLERVVRNVLGRLQSLPAEAGALARALAVLGEGSSMAHVTRLAELDEERVADVAIALAAADILTPDRPLSFTHPIVRAAVYDALPATERNARHLAAARLLHAEGATPDAVASHLLLTEPAGDAWGLEQLRAAAAGAMGAGAPETVVAYLERALQERPRPEQRAELMLALARAHESAGGRAQAARVLEEALSLSYDPRLQARLLLARADVQMRAGEWSGAKETCRRAAELARGLRDTELLAMAALGYGLGPGDAQYVAGVDETLVSLLEEALAGRGGEESDLHVRLLCRLAVELHLTGSMERREALSGRAVDIARRIGEPGAELLALYSRLTATWSPDDLPGRLAGADEVVDRARELHDREMAYRGHRLKLRALLEVGDMAASDREIATLTDIAAEIGRPLHHWQSTLCRAMRALHDGRSTEGDGLAREALELGRRVDGDLALRCFDAQAGLHRWLVGRPRELIPALREVAESCPWLPVRRAALAWGFAELGRRTEAVVQFQQLASDGFDSVPYDGNWLMTMSFLSLACAQLGDQPRAALLYEALGPYEDRFAVSGDCTTTWGPIPTALGVLAAALGRGDVAADHFERALERTVATGAPAQTVFTQREYARMLLARGRARDLERATSLLDDALSTARRHGFAGLAEQALALQASVAGH